MNEDKLTAAAASVAEWRAKIWKLREDIAKAEAAHAESQHRRQQHLLEAVIGDDASKQRLQVLEDDRRAERELEDLRLSLPLATDRLKEAENAHRAAEVEWRKAEVERLARARVAAAAAIDQAFADFSKAWSEYSALGGDLFDLASQEPGANALYLSETIDGVGRLVASLPAKPFAAIREKYPFMAISTAKSMADSERSYWRLPPVEADKAA